MPIFTLAAGSTFSLPAPPQRIVSLVPSQTELLHYLGLEAQVVGITKFCIHPPNWRRQKAVVGGTKNVHMDKVRSLQPDLVLANKEENVAEQVHALAMQVPVYVSDVASVPDALEMIKGVGALCNKEPEAYALAGNIANAFNNIIVPGQPLRVAYLIWQEPYMTVGGDTFIHDMLQHAGLQNVFGHKQRYPVTSLQELVALQPDVLLLSTEPFPFSGKHVAALQPLFSSTKILLADGAIFSWYGSRMLQAPPYFLELRQQIDNTF